MQVDIPWINFDAMWELFRKIGLGFKEAAQALPVAEQQTKISINSANRASGREALTKVIPIIGTDESISSMVQLVLHRDVFVRGAAKRAAA